MNFKSLPDMSTSPDKYSPVCTALNRASCIHTYSTTVTYKCTFHCEAMCNSQYKEFSLTNHAPMISVKKNVFWHWQLYTIFIYFHKSALLSVMPLLMNIGTSLSFLKFNKMADVYSMTKDLEINSTMIQCWPKLSKSDPLYYLKFHV